MECIHLAHYHAADEIITLTKLHEYCHEHPEHLVIYLHNKGSLHPGNKGQDRWRRTMTAAATSQLCLDPPESASSTTTNTNEKHQCNACGMLFQPLPANHFPGNMWAAQCSYITKLLSLSDYQARRPVVDEWIRTQMDAGIFSQTGGLFPMESHYTGKKRYIAEHWLGSHPDLRPCDVSQQPNKDYWLEHSRNLALEFQWAMAPRHDIANQGWIWYRYATPLSATMLLLAETDPVVVLWRTRDFFLLRGMLYRWCVYYDTAPHADSWVWRWFPDGEIWKTAADAIAGDCLDPINKVANVSGVAVMAYPAVPTTTARQLSFVWETISGAMNYVTELMKQHLRRLRRMMQRHRSNGKAWW
jgi:hypothetical protein